MHVERRSRCSEFSASPTLSRTRQLRTHSRYLTPSITVQSVSIFERSQSTEMPVSFRRTTTGSELQRHWQPKFRTNIPNEVIATHPGCELKPPPSLSAALPVRVVRRDRPEPERPMWVPFVGPKRTKASCSGGSAPLAPCREDTVLINVFLRACGAVCAFQLVQLATQAGRRRAAERPSPDVCVRREGCPMTLATTSAFPKLWPGFGRTGLSQSPACVINAERPIVGDNARRQAACH